jgi:hypothetical protein
MDPDGMKIKASMDAIMAIYHSLDEGESVKIEVGDDGFVKSDSFKEQAEKSNSLVLKDFHFLAEHESIIEVSVNNFVTYKDENGKDSSYEFDAPYDLNMMEDLYQMNKAGLEKQGVSKEAYFKDLESMGFEKGTQVQGVLGATLLPYPAGESRNSTNENIQVIINGKGTMNHRAIGAAHEFVHVVLYLKGLPDAHPAADPEIKKRTSEVNKRLGYD